MNASTNARAAIEVSAEDMEEVNSAVSMVELAIMQEGKGGFNMRPEDRSKDFYDTLSSYLASAMKGHPIVEYTMGEVTVHGQTEYTIHSLLGIESLLNERTLPQRIVDIANREAKMKKKKAGPVDGEAVDGRSAQGTPASRDSCVGGARRWSASVERVGAARPHKNRPQRQITSNAVDTQRRGDMSLAATIAQTADWLVRTHPVVPSTLGRAPHERLVKRRLKRAADRHGRLDECLMPPTEEPREDPRAHRAARARGRRPGQKKRTQGLQLLCRDATRRGHRALHDHERGRARARTCR